MAATITEDYVSLETAKLLKEKGFDEDCYMYYPIKGGEVEELTLDELNYHRSQFIKAPTHQMAMKWLREVHNKYCDVGYDIDLKWFIQIIDLKKSAEHNYPENGIGFKSYEEACEEAIKYCLENLI